MPACACSHVCCSWVTGYFNLLGQFAVTAGIDFTFAAFLSTIIMLGTGGAQGGQLACLPACRTAALPFYLSVVPCLPRLA